MYPNLKLLLWKRGMRQNSLAKLLGIDETVLSRIINGLREPSPPLRKQIAALLDGDEEWLFQAAPPLKAAVTPRLSEPAGGAEDGGSREAKG